MKQRLNYAEVKPEVVKAMLTLSQTLNKSGIEKSLLNLIYFRVSQINGCAYCLDMHSKDLRAAGESEQRLYMLDAWREAPFYSEKEKAALEWAEAVTRLRDGKVAEEIYQLARAQFSEEELVSLTLAVVAINGWNRLNIAFAIEGGSYQPNSAAQAA
jgi:AhpD family alkylhydroperoxidase